MVSSPPFLFCFYVDGFLDVLTQSGLGVSVNDIYVGFPMYTDDLALVAIFPDELQAMLNLVVSIDNTS